MEAVFCVCVASKSETSSTHKCTRIYTHTHIQEARDGGAAGMACNSDPQQFVSIPLARLFLHTHANRTQATASRTGVPCGLATHRPHDLHEYAHNDMTRTRRLTPSIVWHSQAHSLCRAHTIVVMGARAHTPRHTHTSQHARAHTDTHT